MSKRVKLETKHIIQELHQPHHQCQTGVFQLMLNLQRIRDIKRTLQKSSWMILMTMTLMNIQLHCKLIEPGQLNFIPMTTGKHLPHPDQTSFFPMIEKYLPQLQFTPLNLHPQEKCLKFENKSKYLFSKLWHIHIFTIIITVRLIFFIIWQIRIFKLQSFDVWFN